MIAVTSLAQDLDKPNRFGAAVNSSIWDGYRSISIAPTVTYLKGKHQFELGFGLHPFTSDNVRMLSTEFNYKYFPNGIENRFNIYFLTNFTHSNKLIRQSLDTRDNYLILTGGYGFQVKVLKNAYFGTNVNIGGLTKSRSSEDPNYNNNQKLFDRYYLSGAIRLNIGYRF
jgi:hypothetical protein